MARKIKKSFPLSFPGVVSKAAPCRGSFLSETQISSLCYRQPAQVPVKILSDKEYIKRLEKDIGLTRHRYATPDVAECVSTIAFLLNTGRLLPCAAALLYILDKGAPANTTPKLWGLYRISFFSDDAVCVNAPAIFVPTMANILAGYLFWSDNRSYVSTGVERELCVVRAGAEYWRNRFMVQPGDFTPFDIPDNIRTLLINLRTTGHLVSNRIIPGRNIHGRSFPEVYRQQKDIMKSLRGFSSYFGGTELPPNVLAKNIGRSTHILFGHGLVRANEFCQYLVQNVPNGHYTVGKNLAKLILPHIASAISVSRCYRSVTFFVSETQVEAMQLLSQYGRRLPLTKTQTRGLLSMSNIAPYPSVRYLELEDGDPVMEGNEPGLHPAGQLPLPMGNDGWWILPDMPPIEQHMANPVPEPDEGEDVPPEYYDNHQYDEDDFGE